MDRIVGLVDMNSYYASVFQAENPELQGKEVIVAGDPEQRTGIVLASSYPAKAKGLKTGMPIWEAKKLCPDGIFMKPDFPLFFDYSTRIAKIARDFTDQIELFSVDEFFINISPIIHLWGSPIEIAMKIKERIRDEVGVLCSVGIGPNKLISKMAAGLMKPNGLTWIKTVPEYQKIFFEKPVRKLFGIGPRYEKHLRYLNVHTIGDLANFPIEILKRRWGKNGAEIWYCANGIDYSPVTPGSLDASKSIGKQKTLPKDLSGFESIKVVIRELSLVVSRRVRQGGYVGRTIFLTLRDSQLRFLSRSMVMPDYSDLPNDIYKTACKLLKLHWDESWAVRLVGVTLSGLIKKEFEQYDIFGQIEKDSKLAKAVDSIQDRYGDDAIFRGISLTEVSLRGKR